MQKAGHGKLHGPGQFQFWIRRREIGNGDSAYVDLDLDLVQGVSRQAGEEMDNG